MLQRKKRLFAYVFMDIFHGPSSFEFNTEGDSRSNSATEQPFFGASVLSSTLAEVEILESNPRAVDFIAPLMSAEEGKKCGVKPPNIGTAQASRESKQGRTFWMVLVSPKKPQIRLSIHGIPDLESWRLS